MPLQGTVILGSRVLAQTCLCLKSRSSAPSAIVFPPRTCSAPAIIYSLCNFCGLLAARATTLEAEELTVAFASRFSSSTEQSSASRLMRRHKRRRRKQKAPRIERVPRGWVSWGGQCWAKWAAWWISPLSAPGLIRDLAVCCGHSRGHMVSKCSDFIKCCKPFSSQCSLKSWDHRPCPGCGEVVADALWLCKTPA